MKPWKNAIKDGLVAGTVGGLTSLAALAVGGRVEGRTPWGPVNAPSHWLFGNRGLKQDEPRPRYTVTGLLVHQVAAAFWGVVHEKILGMAERPKSRRSLLRDAAVTTAVAAVVDLAVVPHRLTPGFQERLSGKGLVAVYSLFALGLALGSHMASRPAGR